MKRKLITLAVVLAGSAGLAIALIRQQAIQKQVYKVQSWSVSAPTGYTEADEIAYMEAAANNDPFPTGWTKVDDEGDVTATLTGYVDIQTGERQLTVTVLDDSADVASASLYLDGTLVYLASRASGSIVDRSGKALATMSTLIPAAPPFTVEVRWVSDSGVELKHTLSL